MHDRDRDPADQQLLEASGERRGLSSSSPPCCSNVDLLAPPEDNGDINGAALVPEQLKEDASTSADSQTKTEHGLKKAALSSTIGQATRPELSDLLLGRAQGRINDRQITLFFNYAGLGYQFAATGHVIYARARALGLGRELDTDLFTSAVPS